MEESQILQDLESIKVFDRKAKSDFSAYRILKLEITEGKCVFQIDNAYCLYNDTSMLAFHLLRGLHNAGQIVDEQDKVTVLSEAITAKGIENIRKVVIARVQNSIRVIIDDVYDDVFSNISIIRLMCINAYDAAKSELESKLN